MLLRLILCRTLTLPYNSLKILNIMFIGRYKANGLRFLNFFTSCIYLKIAQLSGLMLFCYIFIWRAYHSILISHIYYKFALFILIYTFKLLMLYYSFTFISKFKERISQYQNKFIDLNIYINYYLLFCFVLNEWNVRRWWLLVRRRTRDHWSEQTCAS